LHESLLRDDGGEIYAGLFVGQLTTGADERDGGETLF
jgi:hypothetical protein